MAQIHIYLPDNMFISWKEIFAGETSASKWVQDQFSKLLQGKFDLKTLKQKEIELKKDISQNRLDLETIQKQIKDYTKYQRKMLEKQKLTDEKLSDLEPHYVVNMTKGIAGSYGIKDQDLARKLAIEYLTDAREKGIYLKEFMKKKMGSSENIEQTNLTVEES